MKPQRSLPIRYARLATVALLVVSTGCATRSISDPGFYSGRGNASYTGELSDFDLVGTASGSEGVAVGEVSLRARQRVLVVKSGAAFPDERVLSALAKHFEIGAASGIPTASLGAHGMRHAAARGNFDAVIGYWGVLESSVRATPGAAVSWVPFAGLFVPDASQELRVRLRIVVLDVRTGSWRTLLPPPVDDSRSFSAVTRESNDRNQVSLLMDAALPAAIATIEREVLKP